MGFSGFPSKEEGQGRKDGSRWWQIVKVDLEKRLAVACEREGDVPIRLLHTADRLALESDISRQKLKGPRW